MGAGGTHAAHLDAGERVVGRTNERLFSRPISVSRVRPVRLFRPCHAAPRVDEQHAPPQHETRGPSGVCS